MEREWQAYQHDGSPFNRQRASACGEITARAGNRSVCARFRQPNAARARDVRIGWSWHAAVIDPDLVEWNYGEYEGLTPEQIHQKAPHWLIFRDGCPGGETPEQVGARVDRVVARVRAVEGNVAVFAHGHLLRVLVARWIALPAVAGQHFLLDTGTLCVLGHYGDTSRRQDLERAACRQRQDDTPGRKAMNEAITPLPDAKLLAQYGCGPIRFSGDADALYERHLLFDNVVAPAATGPRERFEAAARSVRDVLSQRWVLTDSTYDRQNPKRIYYLSMEFLIGRSLSNNVTQPSARSLGAGDRRARRHRMARPLEQEPDAGLGNGGLGRLAACFLDSMATMQLPAMGYGLRYEYGMFKQSIQDGWQHEEPDNWLRRPGPLGGRASRTTPWRSSSIARSSCRTGACSPSPAAGLH